MPKIQISKRKTNSVSDGCVEAVSYILVFWTFGHSYFGFVSYFVFRISNFQNHPVSANDKTLSNATRLFRSGLPKVAQRKHPACRIPSKTLPQNRWTFQTLNPKTLLEKRISFFPASQRTGEPLHCVVCLTDDKVKRRLTAGSWIRLAYPRG